MDANSLKIASIGDGLETTSTSFRYVNSDGLVVPLSSLTVATLKDDGFTGFYKTGDEQKTPVRKLSAGKLYVIVEVNGIKCKQEVIPLKEVECVKYKTNFSTSRNLGQLDEIERDKLEEF